MEILDNSALTIVLVSPRNTLNIGAVARAMSNFGCIDLRVAAIFYKDFRKATSAVGPSAELLRNCQDYDTLAEAIADCMLVSAQPARQTVTSQSPTSGLNTRPYVCAQP